MPRKKKNKKKNLDMKRVNRMLDVLRDGGDEAAIKKVAGEIGAPVNEIQSALSRFANEQTTEAPPPEKKIAAKKTDPVVTGQPKGKKLPPKETKPVSKLATPKARVETTKASPGRSGANFAAVDNVIPAD